MSIGQQGNGIPLSQIVQVGGSTSGAGATADRGAATDAATAARRSANDAALSAEQAKTSAASAQQSQILAGVAETATEAAAARGETAAQAAEMYANETAVDAQNAADSAAEASQVLVDAVKYPELAAPTGTDLVGFLQTGQGSVPRSATSKLGDHINAADFGLVSGITSDQTAALQRAIDATPTNGRLEINEGVYFATTLTVTRAISIVGRSYGKYGPIDGIAPAGPAAVTLVLATPAAYLIKFGSVTLPMIPGFSCENIVFSGGNRAVSDAVVIIENATSPYFRDCHFSYALGKSLRMRMVWEPLFSHVMFRSNDSRATNGVIVLDSVYNGVPDNNCNNIRFLDSCHFENNRGVWFFAADDANVDILQVQNAKFEWGLSAIPAEGPWPVFKLGQVTRIDINHNSFTNFNAANKYEILDIGATAVTSSGQFLHNQFLNASDATVLARVRGRSSLAFLHNTNDSAGGSTGGTFDVLSSVAQELEPLRFTRNSNGPAVAFAGSQIPAGYISAHECSFNNDRFVSDSNSLSVAKTVQSSATVGEVLCQLDRFKIVGNPTAVRIAVRARASTSGTIDVITPAGTTTFTLTSTYATYVVNLTAAQIAAIPSAGYVARISVGSASPSAVFVDGLYVVPLSSNVAGMDEAYFQGTLANGGSTTISVPNTANPNRRGVYLITADTGGVGYAMFHSSGTALTPINVGGDFAVGTADPASAGKVNVFLSGSNIVVRNDFGSSRVIAAFPFMHH